MFGIPWLTGPFIAAIIPSLIEGVSQGVAAFKDHHASLMAMPLKTSTVADAIAADDAELARREAAQKDHS